jgi:L-idonate 5-dehydrogenase
MAAVKRGGVVVQAGTLPHEPLPFVVNEIMAKEIDLRGVFRWGIEFDWAVDYLATRRVDVRPLLSGQYPLQEAVAAFAAAADKNRSTKVQVVFA